MRLVDEGQKGKGMSLVGAIFHVIKMSLGGACQTSLGPHIFTIAPD